MKNVPEKLTPKKRLTGSSPRPGGGGWGGKGSEEKGKKNYYFSFLHLLKEDPSTLLEFPETKDCQQHFRESISL